MDLEKSLRGVKLAGKAAGVMLPIFQKENLNYHVDKIIADNPRIKAKVDQDPLYRNALFDIADDHYKRNGKYITGAKLIDSMDRKAAIMGEIAEFFPGVGNAARAGENTLELLPKVAYAAWYANHSKDYKSIPYFAAMEAASFIPYVGELVDFSNLYLSRARKDFRSNVINDFIKKFDKKPKKKEIVN